MKFLIHETTEIRRLAMTIALMGIAMDDRHSTKHIGMIEIAPRARFLDAAQTFDLANTEELETLRSNMGEAWLDNSGVVDLINKERRVIVAFYDKLFPVSMACQFSTLRLEFEKSNCHVLASFPGKVCPMLSTEHALISRIAKHALPYAGGDVFNGFVRDMVDVILTTYEDDHFIKDKHGVQWSRLPINAEPEMSSWPNNQLGNGMIFDELEDWLIMQMQRCATKNTVAFNSTFEKSGAIPFKHF